MDLDQEVIQVLEDFGLIKSKDKLISECKKRGRSSSLKDAYLYSWQARVQGEELTFDDSKKLKFTKTETTSIEKVVEEEPVSLSKEKISSETCVRNNGVRKHFSRIAIDKVRFEKNELADNSYEANNLRGDKFAWKAHNDLIKVKGKAFRHAKTKKKRGNYRGAIDMNVRSIKF